MAPRSPAPPGILHRDSSADFVNSVNNVSLDLPAPTSSLEASKHGGRSEDDADGSARRRESQNLQTLHGDTAARRRAITELLFFASVGDVKRCQRIVRLWNLKVSDISCCDYDKRTPLHLAASEGSYKVTEWLLEQRVDVNAVDRFNRTPLEDAVRGGFNDLSKLFLDVGAKVWHEGKFVALADSPLSGAARNIPDKPFELDPDWEVDPESLEIMEKIGEGEFGIVHKAMWCGTLVAAKILKDSSAIALGDFRAEVSCLQKVHHPNAVQFLGACTKQEPYILITELMTGGSMADTFRMIQAVSVRRAVELALDAARGLAYLHKRKPSPIVHRDLKPANLMISGNLYQSKETLVYETGIMKLADFGLSKTLPLDKHANYELGDKFKLTGETGSYRYMAPEVFRHEPYSYKVDVYSYSMILYQLFEHHPPFVGLDPVEAARQAALYDKRPNLIQLSERKPFPFNDLAELVEACWHANPEKRPHFSEIVTTLGAILDKIPRKKGATDLAAGGGGCCSIS